MRPVELVITRPGARLADPSPGQLDLSALVLPSTEARLT